jgi:dTDP-4-dehydrorhamnose reductase
MSEKRVCVFGSSGCLGAEFMEALSKSGTPVDGADLPGLDITDRKQVRAYLEANRPDVVVNSAAYTAVDRAESEPEKAFRVNEWGAEAVAREAAEVGAKLVFFSTDFVFSGSKREDPYTEEDATAPQGVYARSKLAGEHAVMDVHPGSFVLRIGGLYGRHGKNFFSTLPGRIAKGEPFVLDNQRKVGPTWSRCVVEQSFELLDRGSPGLYHATCQGSATWAEFGAEVCRYLGAPEPFTRVESGQLALQAPRPAYAVLDNRKLRQNGLDRMPFWKDALHAYLDTLKGALS